MVRIDSGTLGSSKGSSSHINSWSSQYQSNPVLSSNTSSFSGSGGSHRIGSTVENIQSELSNLVSNAKSGVDQAKNFVSDALGRGGSSSGYTSSARSGGQPQLDYLDAPLAQHYGMDASTAYQEALSNNAVQRHVLDLQKAGLNPVLGLEGNGASVFSGDVMSSAGSGGYGYSGSSASGLSDAVKKGIPDIVGGVVTAIAVSKRVPGAYAIGGAAKNVSKGLITAFA